MTTYTIPARSSGEGSIHDIASTSDRVIRFGVDCRFAVVLASYYGGRGYTTHRTEASAMAASRRQSAWSHQILDTEGTEYEAGYDCLIAK